MVSGPGSFWDTMLSELWVGHGTEMVVACLASVLVYALGAWIRLCQLPELCLHLVLPGRISIVAVLNRSALNEDQGGRA